MYRTKNQRKIAKIIEHNINPVYWDQEYAYFIFDKKLREVLESYEIFMIGFSKQAWK